MKQYTIIVSTIFGIGISGYTAYAIDPTFHLKNNSADAIQIDIIQNNRSLTSVKSVAKNGSFAYQLDTSKPTTVELHYCPSAEYCKKNLPEKLIATVKAGKTVYIKFDGKKLEPQKGNAITHKTTQGYSTKNNITKQDIKITASLTTKEQLGMDGIEYKHRETPSKPAQYPKPAKSDDGAEPTKPRHPASVKPKPSMPEQPSVPPTPAPTQSSTPAQNREAAWKLLPEANKFRDPDLTLVYMSFKNWETPNNDLIALALRVYGLSENFTRDEFSTAYRKLNTRYRQMIDAGNPVGYNLEAIVEKGHDILQKVLTMQGK